MDKDTTGTSEGVRAEHQGTTVLEKDTGRVCLTRTKSGIMAESQNSRMSPSLADFPMHSSLDSVIRLWIYRITNC